VASPDDINDGGQRRIESAIGRQASHGSMRSSRVPKLGIELLKRWRAKVLQQRKYSNHRVHH